MFFLFQLNESQVNRRDLFVQMVDATDRVTPKTGLNLTVQIVKAGSAAYVNSGAVVSEIGVGTYRLRLANSDLDTLGAAMLKVTATGALNQYVPMQVVRIFDEVHLAKAALVNSRSHVVHTGVDTIKDDDGTTILRTLTPSETGGIISVAVS